MGKLEINARRAGKTLAAVEATKAAKKRGLDTLWATRDQAATAELLAKHGALSEIVGNHYVRPHFKEQS